MDIFREIHFTSSSSSSTSSLASSSSLRIGHADHGNPSVPPFELEHMFHKVVTPSDVGKLNRLVIPKQYAEKYFPLDPLTADKGVLLCFEDRTGKQWEFRYSYWNSSQSYVMTKGWSRFVKDKQLDSGDAVSFGRAIGESGNGRLFIDWHPRQQIRRHLPLLVPQFYAAARSVAWWGGLFPSTVPSMYSAADLVQLYGGGRLYTYYQSMPRPPQVTVQVGGGMTAVPLVLQSVPEPRRIAKPKRVRLFGVDLDCSETEGDGETPGELQVLPEPSLQWRIGAAESNIVSAGERREEDGRR